MPFNFWLAWKVTTRRAVIGISSPVFGLRPGRCGLSRNWKLPKPDSLTASPRSSALRISSKKVDHVLGLALVQADLLEQQLGQLGLGKGRQVLLGFLPYPRHLHRALQVGRQCLLEYGRVYVVMVNFEALPSDQTCFGNYPRNLALCFSFAASATAAITASTASSCKVD